MTRHNLFPLIFMIVLSIMPVLFIHMPRILAWLPLLFGLIMSAWWVFGKKEILTHSPKYFYCLAGVSLMAIISVLWSIEPMGAYKQAIKITAILLFSVPLFNLMRSIDIKMLKPFLWLFPAGVTLSAMLASAELALDMPIYRATHILPENFDLSSAVMNRGVISTTLSFFIAILLINNMDSAKKVKYALLAIVSINVLIMLYLTQCQSAQVAFVVGLSMIFLFPYRFKLSYKILASLIALTMVLTPLVVQILFDVFIGNAQEIPWIKDAYVGNRVEIWDFVMRYALNNPIYGYGIEATRFIKEFEHDYIYHKGSTILHPHNFSIQIWIEFGIIGILLAAALIAFVIKQISKIAPPDRRIVIALLIATLAVSSTGYGMWQSWWIGEFMLLISLCALIAPKKYNQP